MKHIFLGAFVLLLSLDSLYSWDRYDNETEQTVGNYSFQKLLHYSFSLS